MAVGGAKGDRLENVLIGYLQLQLRWGSCLVWADGSVCQFWWWAVFLSPLCAPLGALGHAVGFSFMNPLGLMRPSARSGVLVSWQGEGPERPVEVGVARESKLLC